MLARSSTILSLIPKPYYRTSVQRHIRCCSVLLANRGKNEGSFQMLEKLKTTKDALENKFRNRFPRIAEKVFLVRDGVSALIFEVKEMMILQHSTIKGTRSVHDLSLRELELLYETHLQVKKILPVLVIFAIPLIGNFIVVFLAYKKPHTFLTSHFWTTKQKVTYAKEEHANRVSVFLPIIEYVDTNLPVNTKLAYKFQHIVKSIDAGLVPNLRELAACKELFSEEKIFSLERLSSSHVDNLMMLHNLRSFFFKNFYLHQWGSYMKLVDRQLGQSDGVPKLSCEQLKKYCFQRGVNGNAMTETEMRDYLYQWIAFSDQIPGDSLPLLLHAPAFIGFNHKSNIKVTHDSL